MVSIIYNFHPVLDWLYRWVWGSIPVEIGVQKPSQYSLTAFHRRTAGLECNASIRTANPPLFAELRP